MYLTSVQRCADLNRGFSLANAPTTRRQTRAPLHMDLESCVYAVSGFFVLGDRTRRGCCARSIIPGAVRSARGVDRVARSLDRASPAGFHAQPHRPTGRVLTHSPRAKRLTHVSRSFHIESGVWRLPMRVRFLFELCRTRGSRENFMDSQKLMTSLTLSTSPTCHPQRSAPACATARREDWRCATRTASARCAPRVVGGGPRRRRRRRQGRCPPRPPAHLKRGARRMRFANLLATPEEGHRPVRRTPTPTVTCA